MQQIFHYLYLLLSCENALYCFNIPCTRSPTQSHLQDGMIKYPWKISKTRKNIEFKTLTAPHMQCNILFYSPTSNIPV